jgi:hypothetical protein
MLFMAKGGPPQPYVAGYSLNSKRDADAEAIQLLRPSVQQKHLKGHGCRLEGGGEYAI